jgi:chemotaxis protein methyltransferase CheR
MQTTDRDLKKVRDLVYAHTGISLGDKKDMMIKNRLNKLFQTFNDISTFSQLENRLKDETFLEVFINTFTTNKTHFFREHHHFEDMRTRAIANALKASSAVKIYCSASSTGEEPYSIALTCEQSKKDLRMPHANFHIDATDIDTNVLRFAQEGVYKFSTKGHPFPNWLELPKYFKRRKVQGADDEYLIKVKEQIKRTVKFSQMNLFNPRYPFGFEEFDIIFCRNVLIYFDIPDQEKILAKLFSHLKIGGTLYLGHSESALNLTPCVHSLGQNIFVKHKGLS